MTASQFRAALDRLGWSQVHAGALFKVEDRTVRRWASGESAVPHAVARLLALLESGKIEPADIWP